MMKSVENLPKVSVIIPVYNAQDYLKVCINSVLRQSYSNLEIICVNDGSNDSSENIIKIFMLDDDRIKLISIENHGQGYARNLGMSICTGEYVLFLDSDDFIEERTIELSVRRAETDNSDFVVFDYRYYRVTDNRYIYTADDNFFENIVLKDENCCELLKMNTLYTVNKLYRKEFLQQNNIKYLEGYFYEDMIFMVKNILCARNISLIHSPLYRISINSNSVTKTQHSTDKHSKSFIIALDEVVNFVNIRDVTDNRIYYLYLNLFKKFIGYYNVRVPKNLKGTFALDFLRVFSKIKVPVDMNKSKFFSICLKNNWWQQKRKCFFSFGILYSSKIKPYKNKVKRKMSSIVKNIIKKLLRKLKLYKECNIYRKEYRNSLYNDVILFYGFDNRYTGNSRYLFEEMMEMNLVGKKLYFITDNPLVPLEYRIEPNSERSERFIARAKTIVFESWVPLKYKKRNGTNWIQLWHGTPLKKMLFDSNEKYIVSKNPSHKRDKYNDILRWDYLLTDNFNVNKLFNSAFLFNKDNMLPCGYPRVKWLIDKKDTIEYKCKLKRLLGIPLNKKIVLYIPTWRDYNYGIPEGKYDLNYLINLNELQRELGDEYEIVYKDHPFCSAPQSIDFKNYCSAETQELLLIADYLITDYSSVLFDALAIDLPIILYCNDFAQNEEARGVYEEVWEDLKYYVCENNKQIKELIGNYKIDSHYRYLQEKYSYNSKEDFSLTKFIRDL